MISLNKGSMLDKLYQEITSAKVLGMPSFSNLRI
jgi:hypothetical protein